MRTSILPLLLLLLAVTVAASPTERLVAITAPGEIAPGGEIKIVLAAATDRTDGEQIGFLHSDYSTDGGKTWRNFCYVENAGPSYERPANLVAGPAGSMIVVRLRVAFRGGRAGDVDLRGRAIEWDGSWAEWRSPPARLAIIYVR